MKSIAVLAGLFLALNTGCYADPQHGGGHGGGGHGGGARAANHVSHAASGYNANSYNAHYSRSYNHNQYNHHYQNGYYSTVYPVGFAYDYATPYVEVPVSDDDDAVLDSQSTPSESWVDASDGQVPDGAVVNGSDQNGPTYYCMATYNNQTYNGVLVPNEGCYVDDAANGATIRLNSYAVLVAGS